MSWVFKFSYKLKDTGTALIETKAIQVHTNENHS